METIFETNEKDLTLLRRGKVRDIYLADDNKNLLIVATDRISAFDCVLPTPIPEKGLILTQLSNFWFEKTSHIVKNHLIDPEPFKNDRRYADLQKRTILVRKSNPLPIEAIVRGYLAGSGWKEYQKTGQICGVSLPNGLQEAAQLPEPIFTPSTKSVEGHDENITIEEAGELIGTVLVKKIADISLELYNFASKWARERGIIIADTKFEFGFLDNQLLLIDEILTPDSSRFWPLENYQPGISQPSFDKQYIRDYLESIGWNKQPPAPELPTEIVTNTTKKYREALTLLTK